MKSLKQSVPPRRVAILALGLAAVLGVPVLPTFLVKLGVLLGGLACIAGVVVPWLLGPDRARRAFIGSTLLGASFAAGLIAAEFLVRVAYDDVTTTGDNTSYFALRWMESVSTNRLGFREREVQPRAAPGVYRIAVIGDSYTWGQGIRRPDRMTERLERALNDGPPHFEVLNFGRPGAETVDHLEILRTVVLPLHPDFVLLQWFTNDVEGRDKTGRPVPWRLVPLGTATAWLHRHSALHDLLDDAWRSMQVTLGLVGEYKEYMDRRFSDPQSPDMIAAQAVLGQFVATARAASVDVGIVAFPSTQFVDSPGDFGLGYLIDRVMELCTAEEIPCLDLREAFAGATDRVGWWANRLDPHPGPRANEVAAQAVLARFGDLWIASAGARSGRTADPISPSTAPSATAPSESDPYVP